MSGEAPACAGRRVAADAIATDGSVSGDARKGRKDSLSEVQNRSVTATRMLDQVAASKETTRQRLMWPARASPPTQQQEPWDMQRYDAIAPLNHAGVKKIPKAIRAAAARHPERKTFASRNGRSTARASASRVDPVATRIPSVSLPSLHLKIPTPEDLEGLNDTTMHEPCVGSKMHARYWEGRCKAT